MGTPASWSPLMTKWVRFSIHRKMITILHTFAFCVSQTRETAVFFLLGTVETKLLMICNLPCRRWFSRRLVDLHVDCRDLQQWRSPAPQSRVPSGWYSSLPPSWQQNINFYNLDKDALRIYQKLTGGFHLTMIFLVWLWSHVAGWTWMGPLITMTLRKMTQPWFQFALTCTALPFEILVNWIAKTNLEISPGLSMDDCGLWLGDTDGEDGALDVSRDSSCVWDSNPFSVSLPSCIDTSMELLRLCGNEISSPVTNYMFVSSLEWTISRTNGTQEASFGTDHFWLQTYHVRRADRLFLLMSWVAAQLHCASHPASIRRLCQQSDLLSATWQHTVNLSHLGLHFAQFFRDILWHTANELQGILTASV